MLKPEETFLTVIDVQGKLAEIVDRAEKVRRNVRILIEGAKLFGLPVVATEQVPDKLGATVPDVAEALEGVPRLTKVTFSCVGDREIRGAYEATGRRNVLVCGIECHVCVYQTVRDLLDLGFHVHLVRDATSSRDPANKEVACDRMREEGAKITSTEMVLFELQQHCENDRFRTLSRLVK